MAQGEHRTSETSCPVCGSNDLAPLIEMPQVPVHCNVLCSTYDEAVQAPKGDIQLEFCWHCAHTFNAVFQPNLVQYSSHYENSLHFSPRFQAYAKWLAARLIDRYDLHGKDIIEIGCGQGEFLSMLCDGTHNRGLGFDPSYEASRAVDKSLKSVTFVLDYYDDAYAAYKADLICCRQVLEHIQRPLDFLRQIRRTIGDDRPDTVVFFEVPNALYTLEDLGIWDIIYEHCSYFSAQSLTYVFQEAGFTVQDVYPVFGEQFLCLEAVPSRKTATTEAQVIQEVRPSFSDLVSAFNESYQNKVSTWSEQLSQLSKAGTSVLVWGAGSKGVTFLNLMRSGDHIDYVVDINPHKQGKYVAGTGQRIISPEFVRTYQPGVVLLMNPNYHDEVRTRLRELDVKADIVLV